MPTHMRMRRRGRSRRWRSRLVGTWCLATGSTPRHAAGHQLLAHELAHVVQQGQHGSATAVPARLSVAPAHDPAEHAAHRIAGPAAGHGPSTPRACQAAFGSGASASPRAARLLRRWLVPCRRIIYLDANVFDQISRGNTAAANALTQLRSSGELRVPQSAFQELTVQPQIPRTAVRCNGCS